MIHIILGHLSQETAKALSAQPDPQKKKSAEQREQEIAELLARPEINASLVSVYWTLGAFDIVIVFEAASGEHAAAGALALATRMGIGTTTLSAFDTTALQRIMDASGYGAHGYGAHGKAND
jgi:uncharacterized protein with GYD domain